MKSLPVMHSCASSSFDNRLPHLEKSAVAEDNSLRCTRDVAPVKYIAIDGVCYFAVRADGADSAVRQSSLS